MDTLVFIVALGVGLAVVFWYVANEARGGGADFGLFALKGGGAAGEDVEEGGASGRYRPRRRLAPEKRGGLKPAGAAKAYRIKGKARTGWSDDDAEADKEY